MSRYRLTPRALKDLDAIADHTLTTWGEFQAEKYLAEIEKCFERLGAHTELGRARNDIGEGYRSYRQGAHLVFYIVDGELVTIIGIPHMAMDVAVYFQPPN